MEQRKFFKKAFTDFKPIPKVALASKAPVFNKPSGDFFKKVFNLLKNMLVWPFKTLKSVKITRAGLELSLAVFKKTVWHFLSFSLLLLIYLADTQINRVFRARLMPVTLRSRLESFWSKFYLRSVRLLDIHQPNSISRLDLIELSIRNMQAKRTRSIITIGGMAIGIGSIVFLVSIGYGLQQLVISRVARLDEMRQVDVISQPGSKVKINDKTLANFKDISDVSESLPLIAVVGRISYHSSVSDTAVFGVTSEYLKQSAIKPAEGKIFDSNELADALQGGGEVAGASTWAGIEPVMSYEAKIEDVEFSLKPGEWVRVRENPSTKAKILGYTKRTEGKSQGEEIWGDSFEGDPNGASGTDENGKKLGKWIKAPVLLWKQQECDMQKGDCENGKFTLMRDTDNSQVQKTGYFAKMDITTTGTTVTESKVLGVSTSSSKDATDSSSLGLVEIASESALIKPPQTKTVSLSSNAKKEAVVNIAMLNVLGIKENEAIGKKFSSSFVVVGDLLGDGGAREESAPEEYTIVGVTPDEKTPIAYVPFLDLRSLGIVNYSQVKVVVKDQTGLAKVRKQIEAMGFVTRSVADTVAQINSLFATARTILALLGMVALAVAALGMFNTLTVSLLERTHEVGLMKAMGMKSSEVQELFLTESMIMGFFGGISGIILGFLVGKLLGVFLSIFAVIKGVGIVDVSYIPLLFVLAVIVLSLLVGVGTGIYPARRATKISALNALRYE